MPITPLPTPVPSRADPANFAARGDAFLAALPTFATEANALAEEVNENTAICQSAAQTVNVSAWVSGFGYADGANVYDPVTFLTYRRKGAGSGSTRPALDGTNWQLLTGFGDVDLGSTQTLTNKTHGAGSVWAGGAIPVANGGTGATTAAAAFTAIKQAATDAATGVVELATNAEVQTGTDTTRAVTPSGLSASSLGMGQTWQSVTGSRAAATNYTNSTGRPIQVVVCGQSAFTGGSSAMSITVAGVVVATRTNNESTGSSYQGSTGPLSAIVPNGAIYRVDGITGSLTISSWVELL
jgi:hypothetical protein